MDALSVKFTHRTRNLYRNHEFGLHGLFMPPQTQLVAVVWHGDGWILTLLLASTAPEKDPTEILGDTLESKNVLRLLSAPLFSFLNFRRGGFCTSPWEKLFDDNSTFTVCINSFAYPCRRRTVLRNSLLQPVSLVRLIDRYLDIGLMV
mmetsp:Transcript_35876/g.107841  ORF Transcript_35876/g.107841 Transcript_35876/m.107841 type:complete len:148 (-) Transcript_35876:2135-2578(-)